MQGSQGAPSLTSVPGVGVEGPVCRLPAQQVQLLLEHHHAVVGARAGRLPTEQLLQLARRVADPDGWCRKGQRESRNCGQRQALQALQAYQVTEGVIVRQTWEQTVAGFPLIQVYTVSASELYGSGLPFNLVDIAETVDVGPEQALDLRRPRATVPFLCDLHQADATAAKLTLPCSKTNIPECGHSVCRSQ